MKNLASITLAAFVSFAGLPTAFAADAKSDERDLLTIGDPAPKLDIEHWVQDGDGKLSPVEEFKEGTVYIIEFWATWCGPCISSMPHLAETQEKYGYEKVRLVSVSDEDLKTVEKFLEKKVRGEDEDRTYGELTSGYSLTTDPDRSVNNDYMRAAGQNGIPTAFIVGKSGAVEWIGHPMRMDKPLEQIVDGTWDRDAFADEFKKEQAADLLMQRIAKKMRGSKEDCKEAIKLIDEALDGLEGESISKMRLEANRLRALCSAGMGEEAAKFIEDGIASADDDVNSVMSKVSQIAILPTDSNLELKLDLLSIANQRVEKLLEREDVKKDPQLEARIHMTMGQLYLRAKQAKEAWNAFNAAKSLSEDDRMGDYLDTQMKAAKKLMADAEPDEEEEAKDDAKEDDAKENDTEASDE
ncbi:MAG: TlpA disulfide reductase family protein [Pirellulaceae bacterium]